MHDRDKSGRGEMEKDYMLSKSAQITYEKQDEKSFFFQTGKEGNVTIMHSWQIPPTRRAESQ